MGYHVIQPNDLEPLPGRPSDTRDLREAVGLSNLGLRFYRVAPGEDIPYSGMHYHDEQEEVFYVVAGDLWVETPEHTYELSAGEVFVAEPGSPHRAYNAEDATDRAHVLAVGAPVVEDGHPFEAHSEENGSSSR